MAVQHGPLPTTGQIVFQFDPAQASMLSRGLISSFLIKATISFPDQPEITAKIIEVSIKKAIDGQSTDWSTRTSSFLTDITDATDATTGIVRAKNYLMDQIMHKNSWLLFGNLEGPNKNPIVIMFYTIGNIGTYSLKRKEEVWKPFDPQLN